MEKYDIGIIGGGAAGILAAISAARRGRSVIMCEKTSCIGKKILATGNGRCNLLNDDLSEAHYNPAAGKLVRSVFDVFGRNEVLVFFRELGLELYSDEGRIFPRTNQASSVLKVLELELSRLAVPVRLNFECISITPSKNGFVIASKSGEKIECRKVIVTGGGKTYPAFGSDGGSYELAHKLGHSIVEPVPVAVPLEVKDILCHLLQGQKIFATARPVVDGITGEETAGELLFTKYGLSGTCILDVSEAVSIALNRRHKTQVLVAVDLVPFMDEEALASELERRSNRGTAAADMLAGILPNKFGPALQDLFESEGVIAAVKTIKRHHFRVTATRGWNEAEFTAGGVSVSEVVEGTLESKVKKGIYFAGEVLDVNGERGGYNLAWAWASGWVAGQTV